MYERRAAFRSGISIEYGDYELSIWIRDDLFSFGLYTLEERDPVTKQLCDFLLMHQFMPHDWTPRFTEGSTVLTDLKYMPSVILGSDFYSEVQYRVVDIETIYELKRPRLYKQPQGENDSVA